MNQLTDEELYKQCSEYGALTLYYRRKFIGLLPEVNHRGLFSKKGFISIFEFAFKLAGLSEEQVKLALRLEERFEDKPILKELLTSGEASIHKLARVASVATPENEHFWAHQVQNLPKKALETLIRDENSLKIDSMPGHNLKLLPEIKSRLASLQEKGIDINQLLFEFLKKRDLEILKSKDQVHVKQTDSRYIPKATREILKKEFGNTCSIPNCKNLANTIHHTQRFSMAKTHDPHFLAPLCKVHHQIAHSIDQKVTKYYARSPHPPKSEL